VREPVIDGGSFVDLNGKHLGVSTLPALSVPKNAMVVMPSVFTWREVVAA